MASADNKALIERFYSAFSQRDHETMASCYSPQATFRDPVFELTGDEIGAMWRMLCTRGKDLALTFDGVEATDEGGGARWDAVYTFSATGRKVHNKIEARFTFGEDGKIVDHVDTFDFWRWSRMALGLPGVLLGWTPMLRGKVQRTARGQLKRFMEKEL